MLTGSVHGGREREGGWQNFSLIWLSSNDVITKEECFFVKKTNQIAALLPNSVFTHNTTPGVQITYANNNSRPVLIFKSVKEV